MVESYATVIRGVDGEFVDVINNSLNITNITPPTTSNIIDYNLHNNTGAFTLASLLSVDTRDFNVVGGHSLATGNIIEISEVGRTYKAKVLNVVVNAITVDNPIDYPFTTSAVCNNGNDDLNVNGAITPAIYQITPPAGAIWDVTRVIFALVDSGTMDDTKFGSGVALTNGIVLRVKRADGTFFNIFNSKSNGVFGLEAFDIEYTTKAGGGNEGFKCRRTFGSIGKNGTVIRLDGDTSEELQVVIQDDLTGIIEFKVNAQGYEV